MFFGKTCLLLMAQNLEGLSQVATGFMEFHTVFMYHLDIS